MRNLILAIAAAEAATGVAAMAAPGLVSRLLFGGDVTGAGAAMSRFAGIALTGLAVACWPGSSGISRAAVRGLLLYSSLATIGLAATGISGTRGPLLWPAVALHAAMCALVAIAMRSPSIRGER